MSAPTNEPARARLARFKRYLLAEWEAAALYRALADAEQDDDRAAVLRELASMEDRHAAHWRAKLDDAGEPLPAWRPSFRSRFLGSLARLFGTTSVLPILERFEGGDAAMYAAEPESLDFSTQERVHGRIFQRLRKGEQPGMSEIARREERHRGAGSGRLRAAVFGVNDGLVSNLSLVMGVAGAGPEPRFVLLAGVAGLLAGAFSMATGEYVSMRVQREMLERELDVERAELEEHPEEEEEELALIYRAKGLPPEEAARVAKRVIADKDVALETLAREELGLDPGELGSPWGAAIFSFLAFAGGALVPVVPYLLSRGPYALALSGALSAVALAAVGGLTALLTGRPVGFGTARMVLLGAASATVTFWVGRLLGVAISG